MAGEGGALLINNPQLIERAHILWHKGTDRHAFEAGHVDRYSWVDVGSSYLPSEITAAFLLAQMEDGLAITNTRLKLWQHYHTLFEPLAMAGFLRRPKIPPHSQHNAHLYAIRVNDKKQRDCLLTHLNQRGIQGLFHYVPLHTAPAGKRYGRCHSTLPVTESVAQTLIRLPLWIGLSDTQIRTVVAAVSQFFQRRSTSITPLGSKVP